MNWKFWKNTETSAAPPVRLGREALRPPMPTITPETMRTVRDMQEFCKGFNRAYDAAATDNYNSDFRGTFGSANTEIFSQRYTIRGRTRTLAKDTAHGKAIIRTFQNNVVGPEPFKLEMRVGKFSADGSFVEEKETNRSIESEWKQFIKKQNFTVRKSMGFMESVRVVEASLVREGSVLCRLHRDYPFNKWGFAVDFLEEDRLQETYQGKSPVDGQFGGGNPIRASIEYDLIWNFPVAYWLLTRHPGEFFTQPVFPGQASATREQLFREQIPATDVIHFNNLRDRAEQDFGMTELDSTVMPLWRIHQYEKALTLSSIASAAKPWWIEKDLPTGFQIPDELKEMMANTATPGIAGESTGTDPVAPQENAGTPANVVAPASRETFPPGFKLKQADPRFPIEAAHEFRLDNLREIAIGAGISYQHASGDFQNLGFIAGLMCMIPFQDHCKVRQNNLVDGGIDRIFKEWLRASILRGVFDFPIARLDELAAAAHFKGKGFEFVNPLVQAQALILLHQEGHLTRQQVQDRLPDGMNFEKLITELKAEKEEMEAAGLKFGAEAEADAQTPTTTATEEGGNADIPPKQKPQRPRTGRSVTPLTMELLRSSENGAH